MCPNDVAGVVAGRIRDHQDRKLILRVIEGEQVLDLPGDGLALVMGDHHGFDARPERAVTQDQTPAKAGHQPDDQRIAEKDVAEQQDRDQKSGQREVHDAPPETGPTIAIAQRIIAAIAEQPLSAARRPVAENRAQRVGTPG